MTNLKELYLDSNQITSIDVSSFWDLDKLQYLSISNNSISFLDERTFANLYHLKVLKLSNNRIELVSKEQFLDLYNLEILDLSNNRLKSIVDFSFQSLTFLQDINLYGNIRLFLSSLKNLFISYESLIIESNKKVLLDSLKPQKEKIVAGLVYYKSINIDYDIDDIDCILVLDFLEKNILMNLRTDYEMLRFLSSCQRIDLLDK